MDKELEEFEKEIANISKTTSNSDTTTNNKKTAIISRKPQLRQPLKTPNTSTNNKTTNNNNNTNTIVTSNPSEGINAIVESKTNEEIQFPNQSLLQQVPNRTASNLGYGAVRGNLNSLANHFHPYGSNTQSLLKNANELQRKAATVNALGRLATANLAVASLARKRAGLDNSDLTMRAVAVNNAINNATMKANAALLVAKQSVERVIHTHNNGTSSNTKPNSNYNNRSNTNNTQQPKSYNISRPPNISLTLSNNNNLSNLSSLSNIGSNLNRYNYNNNYNGTKNLSKKRKKVVAIHQYQLREAANQIWVDTTMTEWPENDFRIFCGDLGNEVSDNMLTAAFNKYKSFAKAKVIRDKRTGKSKGYGFVSFLDPKDFIAAFKEMNGKYVGNRPIKLRKSKWKDRQKKVKNFRIRE